MNTAQFERVSTIGLFSMMLLTGRKRVGHLGEFTHKPMSSYRSEWGFSQDLLRRSFRPPRCSLAQPSTD